MLDKKITKIVVDRNACIGASTCIVVNPEAFDLDDQNIAIVKDGALQTGDERLLLAAQACPVAAILLYNEAGEQVYPIKSK